MTARYTAYSLALELGWSDVDAMLESMTAMQYQEWLSFYRIRNEKSGDAPKTREEQKNLAASLSRALDGYQQRRDSKKGK